MIKYLTEGQFPEAGINFGFRKHGFVLCFVWPNFSNETITRWRFRFRFMCSPRFLWKRETMTFTQLVLRGGENVLISRDLAEDANLNIYRSRIMEISSNPNDTEKSCLKEQMNNAAMKELLNEFNGEIFRFNVKNK